MVNSFRWVEFAEKIGRILFISIQKIKEGKIDMSDSWLNGE